METSCTQSLPDGSAKTRAYTAFIDLLTSQETSRVSIKTWWIQDKPLNQNVFTVTSWKPGQLYTTCITTETLEDRDWDSYCVTPNSGLSHIYSTTRETWSVRLGLEICIKHSRCQDTDSLLHWIFKRLATKCPRGTLISILYTRHGRLIDSNSDWGG